MRGDCLIAAIFLHLTAKCNFIVLFPGRFNGLCDDVNVNEARGRDTTGAYG